MNNTSLPIEILDFILQFLIFEYAKLAEKVNLLPRWYLLPLLRVCKLWHVVSERYLYRTISIGSHFPHKKNQIKEGRSVAIATRKPNKIARDLVRALEANSRAAALVEGLELGGRYGNSTASWTQLKVSLITICPNLRHVDLRKVHSSELDNLSTALMAKSLVSFRTSLLASTERISFPIFDLMQRWPRIQMIRVEGNYSLRFVGREKPPASEASDVVNCCPELREIILTGGSLLEGNFRSLRLMCSGVKKLGAYVAGIDNAAFDELCVCLQAWSPNFEWLSLHVRAAPSSYLPLSEALTSLRHLRELQVCNFLVDVGAISGLPQLKRLCHTSTSTRAVMDRLSSHLEDPAKFPSLSDVAILDCYGRVASDSRDLRDACHSLIGGISSCRCDVCSRQSPIL